MFTMAVLTVMVAFAFNILLLHMDVQRLEKKVVGNSPEGWHKTQMNLWCKEAEEKNPGWVCPDPYVLDIASDSLETVHAIQRKE